MWYETADPIPRKSIPAIVLSVCFDSTMKYPGYRILVRCQGPLPGRILQGLVRRPRTSKAKALKWLSAMAGRRITLAGVDSLDLESLVGRPVRVTVMPLTDREEREYLVIKNILPVRETGRR